MASYISCKMGEVVSLEQGLAINKKSKHLLVESGYPLLRITDMINQRYAQFINKEEIPEKFVAKEDDLIFSRTGQVGLIFRNQKGVIHNNCFRITPVDKLDRGFLYWFLKQDKIKSYINTLASGSAQPDLNHDAFKSVSVSFPACLEEQKKIANIFDKYDNLIKNNNRRIAILEDMAQSLYREWFVNFRYPSYEDNLDADGNPKLIDSPLGQIPEGWEVKTLGELVEFKRKTIKKGNVPESTPYMGLEHFPRKSIALSDWEEVSEIGSNKLAFCRGDILFGKIRPNFHKVGVAQVDGLCSSDTFVLSPKETSHHSLLAMVTFSNEFVAQAVQTAQGSKMPRASWDVLQEFSVCIPDLKALESFNSVVTPAIEQIRVLSLKNRNLKQQRDMLLPKLISGQIELKD